MLRSASWQLHLYAADQAALRQAQDAAEDLGLPLHSFATTGSAPLAPGIVYLVRPDGFVAASSPPGDAARTFAAAVG